MDQPSWLGTHVIQGLTDKFNHHRVKVELGLAHHFLRSAAAAHTEARTRREIEKRDSDTASTDGNIHTKLLRYPFWQVFW